MQEQDTTPTEQQAGDCEHDFIPVLNADFDECRYCNRQFPHHTVSSVEYAAPMELAINAAEPMTLIGGTAGLHMAQCSNDHGFSDCPLLRAALNVVVAREAAKQEAMQAQMLAALFNLTEAHDCRHRYPFDCKHCLDECDCIEDGHKAIAAARGGQS